MSGASGRELRAAGSLPVRVYTPASALRSPLVLLRDMVADLWRSRLLAWQLVRRDLSAQYRQTLLGLLWALAPPLAATVAFVLLNQSRILVAGAGIETPYPLFALAGILCWQTLANAATTPIRLFAANRNMLVKIDFPREALILAAAAQVAFNSLIQLSLMIPLLIYYGHQPPLSALGFVLIFVILIAVGTGTSLILMPVGALYQDVQRALPLAFSLIMLLTPVVYAQPRGGALGQLAQYNPFTPLVTTGRDWLLHGVSVPAPGFWLTVIIAVGIGLIGWCMLRLAMPILVEKMLA